MHHNAGNLCGSLALTTLDFETWLQILLPLTCPILQPLHAWLLKCICNNPHPIKPTNVTDCNWLQDATLSSGLVWGVNTNTKAEWEINEEDCILAVIYFDDCVYDSRLSFADLINGSWSQGGWWSVVKAGWPRSILTGFWFEAMCCFQLKPDYCKSGEGEDWHIMFNKTFSHRAAKTDSHCRPQVSLSPSLSHSSH